MSENTTTGGAFDQAMPMETVTNDAVAGETVFSGAGTGNDGPTGGAPGEVQPAYAEHDEAADITLADESPDAARPDGIETTADRGSRE